MIYAYLTDVWLWISFVFPLLSAIITAPVAFRLNRFKADPRNQGRSIFFEVLNLLFYAWVICCFGGPILFCQWLAGNSSGQPYITHAAIGCIPAIALVLWLAWRED